MSAPPPPRSFANELKAERVQALYAIGWFRFLINLLNGALLLYGAWGSFAPHHGLIWFALVVAVTGVRLALFWPHRDRPLSAEQTESLGRKYTFGAALGGLVWGSTAWWFYPTTSNAGTVLLAFVVGGMTAGAAASNASSSSAFYAFALPAVLPLDARLLLDAEPVQRAMGLMLGVFLLAMAAVNRTANRGLSNAIMLRLRNRELSTNFSSAENRLRELNRDLEERVQNRTVELEATSADLARSGYLARLGSLAAGLAHEINNPLSYVMSNLSFLERTLASPTALAPELQQELQEVVAEALEGAARVRSTVGHLKAMAQEDAGPVGPVDLIAVLESCVAVSRSEVRKVASLERDFGDVPEVLGKRSDLSQVFLNLIFNAVESFSATQKTSRNRIEIRAGWAGGTADVEVRVSDNGSGIPADVAGRIFEPLATGAPAFRAHGAGLGLAMCHRIINELGGRIDLETRPGEGTTLTVHLRPLDTKG